MTTIDTDYRPAAYFRPHGLEEYLLSQVKGAELRKDLRQLLDAGQIDQARALIGDGANWPEVGKALEAFHPRYMGGNYLPDLEKGEVEIARICLHSTTGDVTSVFARKDGKHIRCRVVDEYDGETLTGSNEIKSTAPLTLNELVEFFLGGWDLYYVLEGNFEGDLEKSLAFFWAESEFYPELDDLLRELVIERFPEEDEEEYDD